MKKIWKILVFIFLLFIILGCVGNNKSDNKIKESTEQPKVAASPTEKSTSTLQKNNESEENNITLKNVTAHKNSDSKMDETTQEEYQKALAKQEAEETAEPIETSTLEETSISKKTEISTTAQLSETKKNELIKIVKDYYGSDEVEVIYISPKDQSSTGLIMVTYYLKNVPAKKTLENDLTDIVIVSKQIAEESGIINPNVNVAAMLEDGTTSLGVGNYYSSNGKTDIHVENLNA